MVIPIKNSNFLMFLDEYQWDDSCLKIELTPDVVLLSSWEQQDESSFYQIRPIITKLIDLGCKYFVCAGGYSEQLHDFIDDVIFNMSLSTGQGSITDIMTTWHDTDTNEEVANFFLYSTNVSNSLLVAFLDENRTEDRGLKKAILNLV